MAKLTRFAVAFLLILTAACQKSEVILEGLHQKDANEVVVLLREFHINAEKIGTKERKSVVYKIAVDARQAQDALKILVENKLPKEPNFGLKEVYPPGSAGIIPTKSDERARLFMALQGEIEASIKLLPSVVDARVVLAMDVNQSLGREIPKKGASVTVIYYPLKDSTELPVSADELKAIVASSISDLSVDEVTVIQKPLRPVAYLGLDNLSQPREVQGQNLGTTGKNFIWASLCIVAIALLTAAYTMSRPYLQRRTAQKHSLTHSSEI